MAHTLIKYLAHNMTWESVMLFSIGIVMWVVIFFVYSLIFTSIAFMYTSILFFAFHEYLRAIVKQWWFYGGYVKCKLSANNKEKKYIICVFSACRSMWVGCIFCNYIFAGSPLLKQLLQHFFSVQDPRSFTSEDITKWILSLVTRHRHET